MKTFVIIRPDGRETSVTGDTIFEATQAIEDAILAEDPGGRLCGPFFEGKRLYRFTRVMGEKTSEFFVAEQEEASAEETEETT